MIVLNKWQKTLNILIKLINVNFKLQCIIILKDNLIKIKYIKLLVKEKK